MISIHTFELTLETNAKNFNYLLSRAYKMAKKDHHRVGYSTRHTSYDVRVDDALASEGVMIEYHAHDYRKSIKLRVNPSEVLGGSDLKLWKPSDRNVEELIERLNDHIDDYFDSSYTLDDLILSRVEFTANLDVGKENVPAYIRLMHKIGKVKGFSPKYDALDYATGDIRKERSFDLEGKTNGIAFTVYDKEADLKDKGKKEKARKAEGILRAEVRLKKRKAVQEAMREFDDPDGLTTEEQIALVSKKCKHIFGTIFAAIVPYGDSYRLKDAEQRINTSRLKAKRRDKMLRLLRLVPEKKSLYLAFRELNVINRDEMLVWFAELNVSPVTISKREDVSHLKNIYDYLEL